MRCNMHFVIKNFIRLGYVCSFVVAMDTHPLFPKHSLMWKASASIVKSAKYTFFPTIMGDFLKGFGGTSGSKSISSSDGERGHCAILFTRLPCWDSDIVENLKKLMKFPRNLKKSPKIRVLRVNLPKKEILRRVTSFGEWWLCIEKFKNLC